MCIFYLISYTYSYYTYLGTLDKYLVSNPIGVHFGNLPQLVCFQQILSDYTGCYII
jgi:hypothetical protein